jgi:XTP/dITP diphosphohydrolase
LEVLYFATKNMHKIKEVEEALKDFPIRVISVDAKVDEVQSDAVEEVAEKAAARAAEAKKLPLFVEDSGLFIRRLNGFPGPYSSYVYKTIGLEGILRLMNGIYDRDALFKSAIAFCYPGAKPKVFIGKVKGTITTSIRGKEGFGFDPIFSPDGGGGRTFGEMSLHEKTLFSHRARAVRKLAEWYIAPGLEDHI